MTKGRQIRYSAEELTWIEEHKEHTRRDLHKLFVMFFDRHDVKLENLKSLCSRRRWNTGRDGRIQPGAIPPNKGRRGYHAPGSEKGWFKKGQRSHSYRGPGHEYPDTKDGYIWLVVEGPPRWKSSTSQTCHPVMKHRHLWEQVNGPIPKGHVLKCMDGDKTNCDPANWRLIPQALLPRLAGRWTMAFDAAPPELKETLLKAALLQHHANLARRSIGKLTAQQRHQDRRRANSAQATG